MKPWQLGGAALVAAAGIAALAFHGERQTGGVVLFEAKGFLAEQAPDAVRDVDVESNGRQQAFHRAANGNWDVGSAELARALDIAVALLRETAPERSISSEEMAGARLAEYGLHPPSLVVTAHGPKIAAFRIAFGGANPLGLSRYARVEGREGIWLVPGHVAQAWEEVMKRS